VNNAACDLLQRVKNVPLTNGRFVGLFARTGAMSSLHKQISLFIVLLVAYSPRGSASISMFFLLWLVRLD
jgi:hypothetical protein